MSNFCERFHLSAFRQQRNLNFFFRKGEPDLLVKYNELTQHYKEAYGIDIYIINPGVSELKYHQEQLAEDLKNGLIQTEKYISP